MRFSMDISLWRCKRSRAIHELEANAITIPPTKKLKQHGFGSTPSNIKAKETEVKVILLAWISTKFMHSGIFCYYIIYILITIIFCAKYLVFEKPFFWRTLARWIWRKTHTMKRWNFGRPVLKKDKHANPLLPW